ncbi:S41 family peptidase [Porifericola rhodea]|uniref:S41 family peptidase n=1 Tax=Porifericola rhodea TaxID=930972 RepID=UPI002665556E|nr:S41 family peptidase [Porifericola rhodea]WKN33886.1 S41 family peptidase [Porifericola rhodea]
MKNLRGYWLIISYVFFSFLSACSQDEDVLEPVVTEDSLAVVDDSQYSLINDWVYEVMSTYYFWSDEVNAPDSTNVDPEGYFYSILNEGDAFSYITDDYEGLMEEFSGVYTGMGFAPAFGLLSGSDRVFMIIEYVYADSPADRAGLKRGDIVLAIDGQEMNTENYFQLFSESQYTLSLASYDEENGFTDLDEGITLSAEVINADPVLHHELISYADKKIGYMVYSEFISGENNEWLNSLSNTLSEFAQQGVEEMVVDLRYNPGGEITMAQYLASALAPSSVVASQEVFVKFEYNPLLEASIISYEGVDSQNLYNTFVNYGHNLNLERIYFLTTGSTASSSELLINGLDPYMEVVTIGEPTVGKFYGSWVIPDLEEPVRHNWALMPIVLKYANAEGVTDFVDGLQPDYWVEDNLLEAKAFGDTSDPMLATALSLIGGELNTRILREQNYRSYQRLEKPAQNRKNKTILIDMYE